MQVRTVRNVVIKPKRSKTCKMAGASAKVLRVWVGFRAAEDFEGKANVEKIAGILGISIRQVRKQMDWLEAEGFLAGPECTCDDDGDDES